ncbi:MAG: SDR family NAD(P)-dependent oxidoreductase, partial [Verrucomicrobiota bacterium]
MANWTLVTGASSGIGLAFASLYAEQKNDLFLVARDLKKLKEMKKKYEKDFGIEAEVMALDLSEADAAKKVWAKATKGDNTVETLINNAGVGDYAAFTEAKWDKLNTMMQLNMTTLTQP